MKWRAFGNMFILLIRMTDDNNLTNATLLPNLNRYQFNDIRVYLWEKLEQVNHMTWLYKKSTIMLFRHLLSNQSAGRKLSEKGHATGKCIISLRKKIIIKKRYKLPFSWTQHVRAGNQTPEDRIWDL